MASNAVLPPPTITYPAAGNSSLAVDLPLRLLAALVAYSRVHTGVHYPGDVVVGALIGGAAGTAVAAIGRGR